MKFNKKKGILFWITGLAVSGKTRIAHKIRGDIETRFGPTIVVSGDDLRNIFNFKQFSLKERKILSKKYNKFAKFITDKKINLIFAVIGMFHSMRNWNKKNVENYVEIYIRSQIKTIIKQKKKKLYIKNKKNHIVGIDIKPELPKSPNIVIKNNFHKGLDDLKKELLNKIDNLNIQLR